MKNSQPSLIKQTRHKMMFPLRSVIANYTAGVDPSPALTQYKPYQAAHECASDPAGVSDYATSAGRTVQSGPVDHADQAAVCQVLNQCLADCLDLQNQCRQALWYLRDHGNVEQRFICAQSVQLIDRHVSALGYRITELGGNAECSPWQIAERSGLCDYPATATDPQIHLDAVAFAFWLLGTTLREDCAYLDPFEDIASQRLLAEAATLMERLLDLIEEPSSMQSGSCRAPAIGGANP